MRRSENCFVDTGAFYARYVARDDCHERCIKTWHSLAVAKTAFVTTNFVVSELITLLVYRFDAHKALKAANEIYASQWIEIVSIARQDELSALNLLKQYNDQKFSMTDAVSFVVMHNKKIPCAFSYDHHFKIAGFTLIG